MENYEDVYERFGEMLEKERPYSDPSCTFATLCRRLGVEPETFGEYVYSQVGMTGDEVLEVYRKSERSGTSGE